MGRGFGNFQIELLRELVATASLAERVEAQGGMHQTYTVNRRYLMEKMALAAGHAVVIYGGKRPVGRPLKNAMYGGRKRRVAINRNFEIRFTQAVERLNHKFGHDVLSVNKLAIGSEGWGALPARARELPLSRRQPYLENGVRKG